MKKVTEIVAELAAPVAAEFSCELWDTEYVREAGQWFLRLYLDIQTIVLKFLNMRLK